VITVLVVSDPGRSSELDGAVARMPSLELLHAHDLEQALDRLARNRRIDAVLLLLDRDRTTEVAATILEEDPAAPPLFAPEAAAGNDARPLHGDAPEDVLRAIVRELSASG
jgi:hypothetical protein